ncbi:[protein-PII] uridylyltransferase [Methylomonas sp. MED-D]|uniref:Bifunctional uridylyltransferase/uridylyl-removing enzyme n=1 Tax=Methylomonas koyamae TaxID=702114 RepID=A0A177NEY7_9GAMM|nr:MULTISPECIES: [protein-PII] uridylyltransferase [Methylomonas]MDT4331727.1 [protein-PII] uridylyltransferase [Methylomonas sp. MV1]NJA05077.1 [protein-PII] uridylyltransferase [Methylococcaceae bacterium WWC4]OAI16003.1 bifunctional uridylyltransferase/uridylyl-removing protein [Methylomonas koyamae]WGS84136.1 [protein-PII] uridylyltransferase [Methylomonas sp. UP202]
MWFSENDFLSCFGEENPVASFKSAIAKENAHLKLRFNPDKATTGLLTEKAHFIDNLLQACWKHFMGACDTHHGLVATGGYGRGELFPYSDIDILVLLDPACAEDYREAVAGFANFLWDIGLKPGLSTRSVAECLQAAAADQTVFTSLLEMRLIAGSTTLFETLKQQVNSDTLWPSEKFFPAKLSEQERRYAKFHDTAYNLEPNIKEGPGGLRDLQVISWVFKHHYKAASLRELIKYGFLPKSEYDNLITARDILWRLRFALHNLTGRCEDRLLFDYQRELAAQLGYFDANDQPDVEQFMQFFFKTVVDIERLNEMLLQLLNEKLISNKESLNPIPITANFSSIDGYLEASNKDVFQKQPLALLEIFLILQQSPSLKGIRASTIRLIRKSLPLIDEEFRQNKRANRLFMDILRQPRGITHQLKRMNRYGILAAYLPDFANIVARMQYDLFHIYTVDEHTLFVIRNLRRFSLAKHNKELPFCNNIFLLISKPEILYIAALFHDIAKGRGGDHSTLGETIARQFCQQHELPSSDTKIITWLVRNHLLMSMTAQRKDISDPDIIHDFALHVGSIEYLNYLYLLTVADIRATNPSLWNAWKDALLKELYISTHQALHRGLLNPMARSERLEENRKEAREELIKLGLSPTSIERSWQHVSDDYFLRYSGDEIAWHTVAIAACHDHELPLVLLRPQTLRGSAEIFVYARNEVQIFSICTATLDQLGLTILDARIITTADQYVLNSFQVLEQSGKPITDLHREVHICTSLRHGLLTKTVKSSKNIHKQSRQAKHFPIKTTLTYLENPSHKHTILELVTTDRAGLLSTIGRAFTEQNIQLHDAKITTIGSRAEDMFYISALDGTPITDQHQRQALRDTILQLLSG